jgi:bifunctional DNA-binding transcriptional regulator/antitoxin component of YhaV-PrlF toxin-antitoxin module
MTDISDLDRDRMDELTAGLPTKSAKIRQLAAAGFERADIARYLGIRYQFVYNVLSAPQPKSVQPARSRAPRPGGSAIGESPESSRLTPGWTWTTVRKGGFVQVPAAILEAMGVKEGDQVQLSLDGDVVRVVNRAVALRHLQDHVRRYVPEGVSLVEQLLAERRAEAAGEKQERTDG